MSIQAKPDAVDLGVAVKQMISEIDWREHYRIKAIEESNRSSTTAMRKNIKPEWLAKFTRGYSAYGGET